jgi:hypothetical protein
LPVRAGLGKKNCLGTFASLLVARRYRIDRAAQFLTKFPWFSFLMQAPQALYSLTGYGVILGSVMGFATDLLWGAIQLPFGGGIQFNAPPASDPIMKAARYVSQPAYHYHHGEMFSYEDHWLLLAADIVATGILMQAYSATDLLPRLDTIVQAKVLPWEPWYPATMEALYSEGWQPGAGQVAPILGMSEQPTYLEAMQTIGAGFPRWMQNVRLDFPASYSTTAFQLALFGAGHDVLTWANGGDDAFVPVYEPEEIAVARLFEYGIFPPDDVELEQVELYVTRSLEIAQALGRKYPARSDVLAAAAEAWGGAGS